MTRMCLTFVVFSMAAATINAQRIDVWLGTAKSGSVASQGIYQSWLDTTTGALGPVALAAKIDAPGFLALHPTEPRLYAAAQQEGQGILAAYRVTTSDDGSALQFMNAATIPEGRAAHLAVDRSGHLLLTASYHAGTTGLFALAEDYSIGKHLQSIRHEGAAGVVPGRQEAPHAHWVGAAPDNQFVLVPDLGLDKIMIYRLQATEPSGLSPHGFGVAPPGAGPRHLKFHPDGEIIYVANELALTVTVYRYDAQAGTMTAVQTVDSVSAADQALEKSTSVSEIHVHPAGRFVYVGNRGHDTISVFEVTGPSHTLQLVEQEPVRGSHPRHFNIDPTGRWLVVAGRDSNTLAIFEIAPDTGHLTFTGQSVFVPAPICVQFGQLAR